jgi:hypothetical protein
MTQWDTEEKVLRDRVIQKGQDESNLTAATCCA